MKQLFIAFLLTVSLSTHADTYLYTGAWSKHVFTSSSDKNETHALVAIEKDGWMFGRFDNSYYRETWFVTKNLTRKFEDVEYGLMLGAMRGYEELFGVKGNDWKVWPLIAPKVSYTKFPVQPTVIVLGEAVALTVRFEF